jgi:UDP-N-acetylmuramoylalanine--D-glutamate ligase
MERSWRGKRIIIIGAARQGIALARFLSARGAKVVLNEQRSAETMAPLMSSLKSELPGVEWVCGGHPLSLLEGADMVCPSGGVPLELPLIQEAVRRGIEISNDSQIFLETAPCRVIGITGSAGKTTTTTLVGRMAYHWAERCQARAWVGGNIGVPLISMVDEMQAGDLAVMEVSSFQLEVMTRAPQVAAVLNITPNHLDRHGTMEAYTAAKAHILTCQEREQAGSAAVLCHSDPGAWGLLEDAHTPIYTFGLEAAHPLNERIAQPIAVSVFLKDGMVYAMKHNTEGEREEQALLPAAMIELRGEHNVLNVLAACAIALAAGFNSEDMRQGVAGFHGVAHRLELVREWRGARWYNDSIATAPERAMAGIRAFSEPLILLAGGRDKKLPWDAFASLVHQRVDHLILFGEAADLIEQAVRNGPASKRPYSIDRCKDIAEAVHTAARLAEAGDIILLSPGGTSFDQFRDFEERGEVFSKCVHDLS